MSEDARPPITTTNLVTAAVAVVVVAVAVIALVAMPWGDPPVSEMEREVWRAALASKDLAPILVLSPETVHQDGSANELFRLDDWWLKEFDESVRTPAREAYHDLVRKSARPWLLDTEFDAKAQVRCLTPENERAIRNDNGWDWDEFHRIHAGGEPLGAEYTRVSRVGFSRNGAYALVYVSLSSHGLSGISWLRLLRWTGSAWEAAGRVMLGMS